MCEAAFGISITTGTIQKIIYRASGALRPVYEHIGEIARSHYCNFIDETSWFTENDLQWLWAMVNERVAFYRIDPHRSKQAFEQLIQDWKGILISDSYGCYTKWIDRQTCLAHLIRKLKLAILKFGLMHDLLTGKVQVKIYQMKTIYSS